MPTIAVHADRAALLNQFDSKRAAVWLRTNVWYQVGLPLLVYTVVALVITWPLATQFSTYAAGAYYGDSFEYIRLGWWGKYALQHGLNPFYQSLFGYPDGFFSAVQWAQPLIYWPTALLGFVLNPVAAFNLWMLLEIILSGLTAYWLCLEVLTPRVPSSILAALFGGLVFMAFPTVQGHLTAGHVNPLSNYALPVLALCLYRLIEGRGGKRTALVGAVALWILALGNFTFPAFELLPLVLFGGGYLLLFRRDCWRRAKLLRDLVILFGVGVVLIVPFYLPLLADLIGPTPPAYVQETGWVRYSTDPLSFVALSPFNPWTAPIAPIFSRTVLGTNSVEGTAYLGIIAVALAAIAHWRRRRDAGPWLAIALGCMLFSLGPLLKWRDQPARYTLGEYQSQIVLPWALFQNLPLISATRTPGRFNITTGLALGVLAALGLDTLLRRVSTQAPRVAIVGALATATLLEYQLFFPFPTTPAALPAYFDALASRSDVRAVFDVPWDDLLAQKAALYQQVAHHKPLVAGYISRRTPVDPAKLTLLSNTALGKVTPVADEARTMLSDSGVDVLVYHWQLLDRPTVQQWAQTAFGQPKYQDDQIAIFEVPKAVKQSESTQIAFSTDGWWGIPDQRWLTGDSSMYIYTPVIADGQWTLKLAPLLYRRRVQLSVDGRLVRSWMLNPPQTQIDFWLWLEPGFHTLRLVLPDGCTSVPTNPACLLFNGAPGTDTLWACTLQDPVQSVCVGAQLSGIQLLGAGAMAFQPHVSHLSNGLLLRGFRAPGWAQPGSRLMVETDWQATQKLVGDYHLFVHVLSQDGELVAQADTVPGDGTFPTSDWSVPQDWTESVAIPLPADLPSGRYSLYTGWYSYPDLNRLGVEDAGPHSSDGLIFLHDVDVKP